MSTIDARLRGIEARLAALESGRGADPKPQRKPKRVGFGPGDVTPAAYMATHHGLQPRDVDLWSDEDEFWSWVRYEIDDEGRHT
jgi:hypothetical protein